MREVMMSVVACCMLATRVGAGGEESPQVIVERAIKAAGGEARLAALKELSMKAKGPLQLGIQVLNFEAECSCAASDRWAFAGDIDGMPLRLVIGPDGCFRKYGGAVEAARPDFAESFSKLLYWLRTAQQLVPLEDASVTLTHKGESKIDERAAVVLRAVHKDQGEADIHFDKETGLPVRLEAHVAVGVGKAKTITCGFADHKEFGGVRQFTRATLKLEAESLRISIDATLTDAKAGAKLADTTFAKPTSSN